MLFNNVTEVNLCTHWPRNTASAADTFSVLPSHQMEAAGAPCTAFRAPSMCGLLQEIRMAFTAHCLPDNSAPTDDFYYKQDLF